MIRFATICLICVAVFYVNAANATSAYAKRKRAPEPVATVAEEQIAPSPPADTIPAVSTPTAPANAAPATDNQIMQTAVQSTLSSLSQDQLQSLAECLQKHIDPDTANALVANTLNPAAAAQQGVHGQNAQSFIASPMGKDVMQNCNTEIQGLLPQVQQQFQQDLSQNPALAPAPAR